jgi:hypothetical protein
MPPHFQKTAAARLADPGTLQGGLKEVEIQQESNAVKTRAFIAAGVCLAAFFAGLGVFSQGLSRLREEEASPGFCKSAGFRLLRLR